MSADQADSAFWWLARLDPYHLTRFNVQEAEIAPDARAEAFGSGLAVWSRPGSEVARSTADAREMLGVIVAAYTVVSGVALDLTFLGWVEATSAAFDGSMIGFTVPRGHSPHMSATSKRSRDMASAIAIAGATHADPPWRLALRDVHSAYLALGTDDAFVFAYRAMEDLARASSQTGDKDWATLHGLLSTTEMRFRSRTQRLKNARDAVAHGDVADAALVAARADAPNVVGTSRRIVRDALAASGLP